MASVEDYKGFGKSLSDYVKASNSSELTDAFKEGGALHNALKSLKAQEEELNKYQESLLESFNPGQEGSLTQEQVNQQIEKNDAARNEIAHLQARLNDLSESAGASKSNWNISRAKSEFTKGVDQGLKVENSFFETFVNAIRSAFSFTDKKKIEETRGALESVTTNIENKTDDRVKVPSKVKQQELEQSKGIESPTLSIESGKVNTPDIQETKSNIPEAPPLPSEGLGAKKSNIPEAPPLPPEGIGGKKSNIPEAPPLPSEGLGAKKSNIPEAPPLPPEGIGGKKSNIPDAPPPPLPNEKVSVTPSVSEQSSPKEDLLAQIRNRKKKTKLSKDHMNESGEKDFVYVKSEEVRAVKESGLGIMGAMREQMGVSNEVSPNAALNGKDKEAQMNMLYSAVIDGNDELVKAFKTHETEVDSGRVDDDWGEPIMESKPTFSKEEIESIEQAAIETKQRLERGEDLPSKKSSVEVGDVEVNESVPTKKQSNEQVVEGIVEKETPTVSDDNIPEAPPLPPEGIGAKKSDVPPPPTHSPSVKKPKKEEVSTPKPNLLEEIRNRAGKGLNSVKPDNSVSMDMDGFTYTKPKPKKKMSKMELAMAQRRGAIAGDDDIESQLDSMAEQEQLDMLYSAVIDDDQKKISAIYSACDEDVFTPEAVTKVCEAAVKIAATQSSTKRLGLKKLFRRWAVSLMSMYQ